jgi:hypothetical protein
MGVFVDCLSTYALFISLYVYTFESPDGLKGTGLTEYNIGVNELFKANSVFFQLYHH